MLTDDARGVLSLFEFEGLHRWSIFELCIAKVEIFVEISRDNGAI